MTFSGRRVLVTGAGKGIGRQTARLLAARGATVIALSRAPSDLASLKDEIGCETIAADLADLEASLEAVQATLPIDLLVNNAAITVLQPFLDTRQDSFAALLAVNTQAPMFLAQLVARDLVRRGVPGAIVNVSSNAANMGTIDHAAYCASKAALDALTGWRQWNSVRTASGSTA